MLYLANPCGSSAIHAAMAAGKLGYIDSPRQGNARPAGVLWCADNGVYGKGWPGYDRWYRWLAANASDAPSCLFATAPDVVANHPATEQRSRLPDGEEHQPQRRQPVHAAGACHTGTQHSRGPTPRYQRHPVTICRAAAPAVKR